LFCSNISLNNACPQKKYDILAHCTHITKLRREILSIFNI